MKPKIADVAKIAGVSPTTVSRVLNNRGYIGEATRKKVHDAMKEINYYPNEVARSLYSRKTYLIGLIFPTTSNPFYGQLIFHLENYAASIGYKVLLCNSEGREDKEREYLEMLQRHQVDGIVAGAHNKGIAEYGNPDLPVVGIDRYLSEEIPVVSSDNYEGGRLATQLLVDKGCRNIIHINGPISLETPANLRRRAYEDVMQREGFSPVTYEVVLSKNEKTISRLFDEHPQVDAIFASDDMIALQVMREAQKRNIQVPEHLRVIGYDGTETIRLARPDLSTILQPVQQIAETAIDLLVKQIDGERGHLPHENTLPVQLLDLETT